MSKGSLCDPIGKERNKAYGGSPLSTTPTVLVPRNLCTPHSLHPTLSLSLSVFRSLSQVLLIFCFVNLVGLAFFIA